VNRSDPSNGVLVNTVHVIAACFALAGFAATAVAGVYVGNPADLVIGSAILVLIGGWILGRLLGGVMVHAMNAHVAQYKRDRPLPDVEPSDAPESIDARPRSAGARTSSA